MWYPNKKWSLKGVLAENESNMWGGGSLPPIGACATIACPHLCAALSRHDIHHPCPHPQLWLGVASADAAGWRTVCQGLLLSPG